MKKLKRLVLLLASAFLLFNTFVFKNEHFAISVLMGVSLGLIFFIFADGINRYLIQKRVVMPEIKDGETLLLAEPSTRYIGAKGVMGKLLLTDRRILFQPQLKRGQHGKPVELKRRQIKQIENYDRAFLPTGIQLHLRNGDIYTFATDDRNEWKAKLAAK